MQTNSLKPTETPGVVNAYVLINAKIHTVKVKVPRQVFLNLKGKDMPDVDIPGCLGQYNFGNSMLRKKW